MSNPGMCCDQLVATNGAVFAGGHASTGRTNDLLLLELSGWTWSQPVTTGTAPSPRSGSALCMGHGRYLVIHGGRNNFLLDSAHVLDLMTRTWVDVSAGTRASVEQFTSCDARLQQQLFVHCKMVQARLTDAYLNAATLP